MSRAGPDPSADLEAERLAICLEAGTPPERAERIARCERLRDTARAAAPLLGAFGLRCVCGAHAPRA